MADVSVTAANVQLVDGTPTTGRNAGGTVTAGMAVRVNSSGAIVAAASDSATNAAVDGIALNNASSGQPVAYAGDGCVVNIGGTLVLARPYVLGTASGAIKPVDDISNTEYVTGVGVAQTTSNLLIKIARSGAISASAVS